ncbi:TOMM precursor leader peptide-binding protein [Streptomyces sp. NPDC021093]|uniref:TOMM precursor leader peptide-binding protein n=1 Tax=Streptomyces sp. NPDC021093 TaxID=3365112 RepID=UPI0037B5879F
MISEDSAIGEDSAVGEDSVVRLASDVRLHVQDDHSGFVESPDGVRRLRGTGLRLLADQLLPRLAEPVRAADIAAALSPEVSRTRVLELLEGLRQQRIVEYAQNARLPALGSVAVYGPPELTRDLVAVLRRTRVEVRDLGDSARPPRSAADPDGRAADPDGSAANPGGSAADPGGSAADPFHSAADLLIVSTASLFDPRAGAVNERCVREGLPCLFYGLLPDGGAFAGPLWSPDRTVACFACLRTRIFSNSVHGQVWSACTTSLAASGTPALDRRVPPWTAARLASSVARRAAARLERPADDPADELLWLDEDGGETTRFLLPVPTCPVCADRENAGTAGTEDRRTAGAAAAAPLTAAVDDKVGAVHTVSVRRAESGPPIYLAGSTSPDLSLLRPNLGVVRNGGAGFAKKEALNATIGESLERCAAGLYRSSRLRTASYAQLGEEAVAPSAFGLFSAEQYASPGFPFAPFAEDTRVRWARATRWADGVPCWVPASQVYLYYRRAKEETPIAPSISTGLAAGPTFEDAVLGGLSEIVERDALSVSWLHRLPPRPVPEEVVAASPQVSYHLSGATSWRVSFYDLSLDLTPPVVVAVMDHRGAGGPVLSFGAACRRSPVRAVEKAFLEAAQGLTYVRRLVKAYEGFEAASDFDRVDEFNKHAILYTRHPELRSRAGYLVHPTVPTPCDRPTRPAAATDGVDPAVAASGINPAAADDVDLIVKELSSIGLHTYVVDLTTPDARRLGVHVVRVLVPGLQHLSGAHRFRLLGNPRLHTVVRKLGFDSAPDNPYPHPLP